MHFIVNMEQKEYKHSPIALLVCPGYGCLCILYLVLSFLSIEIFWFIFSIWFFFRTLYALKLYKDEIIILKESSIEWHECKLFSSPNVYNLQFNEIKNINAECRWSKIEDNEVLHEIIITDNSKEYRINIWGYPEKDQMYHEIKTAFREYN